MSVSAPMCALVVAVKAQPLPIQEGSEILSHTLRATHTVRDLTPVSVCVFPSHSGLLAYQRVGWFSSRAGTYFWVSSANSRQPPLLIALIKARSMITAQNCRWFWVDPDITLFWQVEFKFYVNALLWASLDPAGSMLPRFWGKDVKSRKGIAYASVNLFLLAKHMVHIATHWICTFTYIYWFNK